MSKSVHSQRGGALVYVLWISIIVAALLASAISTVRTELQITRSQRDLFLQTQALYTALDIAAFRAVSEDNFLATPTASETIPVGDFSVTVRSYAPHAPLDINRASEQSLSNFFIFLNVDKDKADRLAAQIADWRDADDLARINGAEANDYLHLPPEQRPQNRPFLSVSALKFIKDMTPALYECARPALSVSSGAPRAGERLTRALYGRSQDVRPATTPASASVAASNRTRRTGSLLSLIASDTKGASERTIIGLARITSQQGRPFQWIKKTPQDINPDKAADCPQEDDKV